MRVAISDWCASRMVVSVTSTRSSSSIHWAKAAGPRRSSNCLVPSGATAGNPEGTIGAWAWAGGTGRPAASGLPFTVTSAMKRSNRVARSRRRGKAKSSGVSSMKRVVTSPERNAGWLMTFSRNARLVATPRMRNSRNARSMRSTATSAVGPQAVTFSNNES